jgi:Cdc6-like AAA superfamily ATPase
MKKFKKNPKGSNAYSYINEIGDTTPSGSYNLIINNFYKHKIPSGFIQFS